jgi:GntR family transcriptional regulator/MocR family aminotransferase
MELERCNGASVDNGIYSLAVADLTTSGGIANETLTSELQLNCIAYSSLQITVSDIDQLFEIELKRVTKGFRGGSQLLYQQLKSAILDGRLKGGTQLPPSRRSNAFFGASRNTIAEVYTRLIREGLATGRHGSGTYVAEQIRARPAGRSTVLSSTAHHRLNEFWLRPDVTAALGFWREPDERAGSRRRSARADFRPAMIDSTLFPFDVLRVVMAKQLRALEKKPATRKSAQGNQGNYHLRGAITEHIGLTRAVVCAAEDVIVTSGAQQAFDLLARVLVTPNQTVVAMEDPGYPPMRIAFAAAGAKVLPIGVDAEGLIVDELPVKVDVICVCPSHHFPLGITMSKRRRDALIEYAHRHAAVIIEDDYDGEFRFEGDSLEALRSAQYADVVFYVGTFSKCMLPALRLGFIVAPSWAVPTLIAAKNSLDWHSPSLLQSSVAKFITQGHLHVHVRRMRKAYAARRHLVQTSLLSGFAKWLRPIPSSYGMHVAAVALTALDLECIAKDAYRKGMVIHTFSRYFVGPQTQSGFVFGYGVTGLADIKYGLSLLNRLLSR